MMVYLSMVSYTPVSSDFMMPYNATIECLPQGTHTEIYIDIVRDALIEEIEKFQVILESDEDFDSSCNTTTIVIHDDDCKFMLVQYMYVYCMLCRCLGGVLY